MDKSILGLTVCLAILGLIFVSSLCSYEKGRIDGLAQKCAETQGKYDFCVQKISYEVKNEKSNG